MDTEPAPGAPFSSTWSPDSSFVPLGQYFVCAWIQDDSFNTAAYAQAPLTIRAPHLSLAASVPRQARVGSRGTFTVTGQIETRAHVGILLLPPRAVVCDESGSVCHFRRLPQCPVSFDKADTLGARIQAHITPFAGASFSEPLRVYRGRVRFRTRLKALSAGVFHLCAYVQEESGDAPPPFGEAHAFAAFRVAP